MNNNEYKAKIMSNYFDKHNVPYTCRTCGKVLMPLHGTNQIQFVFNWCYGDVIMDTLTARNVEEDRLVESYSFPWDEEDVTRDYPERMAKRITQYYHEIQEGA